MRSNLECSYTHSHGRDTSPSQVLPNSVCTHLKMTGGPKKMTGGPKKMTGGPKRRFQTIVQWKLIADRSHV